MHAEPIDCAVTNPPPVQRRGLAIAAGLTGASAAAGAFGLITGTLVLPDDILRRVPFDSPVLAGVALALWVAAPFAILAVLAARGDSRTDTVAVAAGLALVAWIVVQLLFIRTFSWFQPTYAAVGLLFARAGMRSSRR